MNYSAILLLQLDDLMASFHAKQNKKWADFHLGLLQLTDILDVEEEWEILFRFW